MKFNAKDLDVEFLKERAKREANEILKSESKTRGRSRSQVIMDCLYGQAAECYLIQHEGFIDDTEEFKDVLDKNRKPVEVKVTSKESYVKFVLDRCNEQAKQKWRNYPRQLYIFIGDRTTLDYHLYGRYCYNGIEFVKEKL